MALCFSPTDQLPFTQHRVCSCLLLAHAALEPCSFCAVNPVPNERYEAWCKPQQDIIAHHRNSVLDLSRSPGKQLPETGVSPKKTKYDLALPKSTTEEQSVAVDSFHVGNTDVTCSSPDVVHRITKETDDQIKSPRVLLSPFNYQPTTEKSDVEAGLLHRQGNICTQLVSSLSEGAQFDSLLCSNSKDARCESTYNKTAVPFSLDDEAKATSIGPPEGKNEQKVLESYFNQQAEGPADVCFLKTYCSEPCRRKPIILPRLDDGDGKIEEAVRLNGQVPGMPD